MRRAAIPPTGRSLLAPILDRNGMLTTVLARNGAPLRPGTISVAAIAVTRSTAVPPVGQISEELVKLVAEPVAHPGEEAALSAEPDPAETQHGPSGPDGPATGFTFPECSGAIGELRESEVLRCRCRVGHSCSQDTVVEARGTAVEAALWTAREALEERGEPPAAVIRRVIATGVPAEEETAAG